MKARAARGFSLLEVLLAMAILLGSLAVLGELAQIGRRNATSARDLSTAQLLAASKLAELAGGALPLDSVREAPFDESPEWLYSIDIEPTSRARVMAVSIRVRQDLPSSKRPIEFVLAQWIRSPQPDTDGPRDGGLNLSADSSLGQSMRGLP